MGYIDTSIRLIIARTDAYLAEGGDSDSFRSFPVLKRAVGSLTDGELGEWAALSSEAASGGEPAGRYGRALSILNGDTVLQTLMELCMAEFSYPEFSAYLEEHFGYGPCIHLASLIEGRGGLSHGGIKELARSGKRLLEADIKSEPLQYARFRASERLFGFLEGSDELDTRLSDFASFYPADDEGLHDCFVNEDLVNRGAAHFEGGGRVLVLSGLGGRRFIARHIARTTGRGFLFLNIADFIRRADKDDMGPLRDTLVREAYYLGAGICLRGFDERFILGGLSDKARGRRDMEALAGMLIEPIIGEGIPLILCVDDARLLPDWETSDGFMRLDLPETYGFDERKRLWQGLFKLHGLSLDAGSFASRYRMNPKEASHAVRAYLAKGDVAKGKAGQSEEECFARISIESIPGDDSGTGRVIFSDISLEDVKLKDGVKRVLKDTVNAVMSGPVILDEWGLEKNYPYGRGVSLLMAGPPGTGKTMSANAIAGELSLPLYQVNLSNTVDKYIGETEKNLEKAFSFAEKNNAILFFDEADALFGSRSEVHDAKDRYANTEISYLLQRMEAYDGVVIMATNIKGNIDPAFMRRIRFVAHFENPDEEMRRAIWEGCLTESVPHGDIDMDYLASQFDKFTGSMIKTVFLNACARAAGDGGELSMKHLVYSIKQEIEKESAVGFAADTLGKYAYLAQQ